MMQRPHFATRAGKTWVFGGLLIALSAVTGLTSLHLATKSSTPAPSLSGGPSNPTKLTTASFTFSDNQGGATFQCALDTSPSTTCISPATYHSLGDGNHTFQVTATAAGMATSSPASYTWTVDATPPVPTLTFPANGGIYGTSAWGAGCSPAGLCGSVIDATGVAQVTLSIGSSTGKYWNGSSFSGTSEAFFATTLGKTGRTSTTWGYALAAPASGSYTVHLRTTDTLGNTQTVGAYALAATFTVSTVAPPAPVITSFPDNPTYATSATFAFTEPSANPPTPAPVSFRCSLDSAAFSACTTPQAYSSLVTTGHTFQVEAVDGAGNVSAPAAFTWTVLAQAPVTIRGDLSGSLYPGGHQQLTLAIANPYNFTISVTNIQTQVQDRTSAAGCTNSTNGGVAVTSAGPVLVPANSSTTVQVTVSMADLSINQDACKGVTFTFLYSATATKG
jgi:hypothetical protein